MTTIDHNVTDLSEQGYYFSSCLYHALTKGVEDYANDTERRARFVTENEHLFAGTMLVGVLSYLESTLGNSWISRCGGRQTRELSCLRFVRNAFVHSNSHVRDLNSYSQHLEDELRSFIEDLSDGKIKDDKGNVYPYYMELSSEGVVTLKREAMNIFRALTKTLSH